MNKETLEEVAEKLYPVHINSILDKYDDGVTNVIGKEDINEDCRESFIDGAKWMQERMYSEEDMQEYAKFCIRCYDKGLPCIIAKDWFEQFKNK